MSNSHFSKKPCQTPLLTRVFRFCTATVWEEQRDHRGKKKQLTALHKEQKGFCGAQTQAAPFKLFHRSHLFGVSRAQKPLGVGRGYLCEFVLCVRTSELFESVNILSENRCQTLVKYLAISSSTPNPSALKDKTERESEGKKEREGNFKISRGL